MKERDHASGREPGVLPYEQAKEAEIISVGAHSYGRPTVLTHFRGSTAKVRIGRYCSLAEGIKLMIGGNHRTDWVTTYPLRVRLGLPGALNDGHPATKGDIVIGNDVWIGAGARILSGVEIGDGAVVGAYAVVATDVRPYAVVVGNPAHETKRRFADRTVEALRRIAWWNWPDERVREHVAALSSSDVESFVRRFDPA
jgi:acetyltransferase-like isoleucine patch superfamily enzyme